MVETIRSASTRTIASSHWSWTERQSSLAFSCRFHREPTTFAISYRVRSRAAACLEVRRTSSREAAAKRSVSSTVAIQTPESKSRISLIVSIASTDRRVVVAHLPDELRGITTHRFRWPEHLFQLAPKVRLIRNHLSLDHPPQEVLATLLYTVGGTVDPSQQIVRDLDLKLGHLVRVSRGFG